MNEHIYQDSLLQKELLKSGIINHTPENIYDRIEQNVNNLHSIIKRLKKVYMSDRSDHRTKKIDICLEAYKQLKIEMLELLLAEKTI